jgi:DNA-binding NtrC family response regulator
LQAKLLQAIKEKSARRLGNEQSRHFDVSLVAATHQRLERAIRDRDVSRGPVLPAKVLEIHLPPLRERGDDAVLLANHFGRLHARRYDRGEKFFRKRPSR